MILHKPQQVNMLEERELTKLLSQLHLMHITNPEVSWSRA